MKQRWNPYLAGALTGVVMIGSAWFTGKFFGASTTFVRTTGMMEQWFAPERVAKMPYFLKEAPLIDWQWMFVAGIFLGSALAAWSGGTFRWQGVPDSWREHFGHTPLLRGAAAFGGGILAMFGARLADGCPSGHGLSGVSQLAVGSLIALGCFFVGGLVMARLLYGRGRDG